MYNLFLDDERSVSDVTWITLPLVPYAIVKNYSQFVAIIEKQGLPDFVSLDHDLAWEHYPDENGILPEELPYDDYLEKTGYHCAQYLFNYCLENNLDLPRYSVHTLNPIGKTNITELLKSYERAREIYHSPN